MSTLDRPMGKIGKRLTRKFGAPATLYRKNGAVYDPSTGRNTAPVLEQIACHAAPADPFEFREIDGTLVQHDDCKKIVSGLAIGYDPTPMRDTLVQGGRTWLIVRLLGISSGGAMAAYVLHLRPAPAEES